jgi:hypothetical protein
MVISPLVYPSRPQAFDIRLDVIDFLIAIEFKG